MAKKKRIAWESLIQRKKNGEPYGSLFNAQLVFCHDDAWQGVLAFDEFIGDIVTLKLPPWPRDIRPAVFKTGPWSEKDTLRASTWLARMYEIRVDSKVVEEAIHIAADTAAFHPVRQWLRGLKWDRVKRLDEMFIRLAGADDTPYCREITKNFLIGAVARVMEPGCQLDSMIVLEGAQGVGKTTFLRTLFGNDWFLSTNIDVTNKDAYQVLLRKWCCEMGELATLTRKGVDDVKQYVSNPVDTYRPSYGRRTADFKRQIVFAGTTNDDAYLKDGTGARRFWPLVVRGIRDANGFYRVDLIALAREREQLFAEALVRYKKGEKWHIVDPAIVKAHLEIAEDKRQIDPWETVLTRWIAKKRKTTGGRLLLAKGLSTHDVLTRALRLELGKLTRADEMRAAQALKLVGYTERERILSGHDRTWVYKKPGSLRIIPESEREEVGQKTPKKQASGKLANLKSILKPRKFRKEDL